jgi:copper chaperone CopZ
MAYLKLKIEKLTCENCNCGHCGHCGQPILFLLKSLMGIMSVREDFDLNTVDIDYEEDIITSTEIIKVLKSRGYDATIHK